MPLLVFFLSILYGLVILLWLTDENLFNIYLTRNLVSHFGKLHYSDIVKVNWTMVQSWKWFNLFTLKFLLIFLLFLWQLPIQKTFFTARNLCWKLFCIILRLILAYVPLFLENCSILSHKSLHRCFLYYSNGYCMKRFRSRHATSRGRPLMVLFCSRRPGP